LSEKIVYLNEEHEVVPIDKATWKVVHTYNEAGMLDSEEWIEIEKKD